MNAVAGFTIFPFRVGNSGSDFWAAREHMLVKTGLHYELHTNGTNPESESDKIMQRAIKTCHERLYDMGEPSSCGN